jgi:hypothetical protein
MLYGPTGSGKTTAAATFPFPLFLVPAAEGSELSLADSDTPFVKLGRAADGRSLPIREHLDSVLNMLEKKQNEARKLFGEGKENEALAVFPWETIVLESMTHLCAMLQDDISQNGRIKMDMQKWGVMSDYLRTVHTRLRALDAHVVFTALSKVEGEDNVAEGAPDIPGKMARLLPSACDAIGFCETIDSGGKNAPPVYRVHFRQHRVYPARTRFRGVPGTIENFTFEKVQQHLPK